MDFELTTQVVGRVFPSGCEISWGPTDVSPNRRFWIIPGQQGVRWIVPGDPRFGWAFLKQWQPYKVSSRLKYWTLMAAYRRGQLGRMPGIRFLGVAVHKDQGWGHLGWTGPKPPVPVIYIGTPGPASKAVVGLIDAVEHGVATVGKIPLGAQARRAIAHEVDVLTRLEKERPGLAPRSLFFDEQTGVAVQEAIGGEPTSRRLGDAHIAWLLNLAIPGESISLREEAETLEQQIAALPDIDPGTRDLLTRVLSQIDDSSPVPATWVHGDFAPWNLKVAPGGTLSAIDWENASPKGLPLFDLIYYRSILTFLFNEPKLFPRSIQPLLRRYMEHMGIGQSKFRKFALACLARDWLRCHEEDSIQRALFIGRQLSEWSRNVE